MSSSGPWWSSPLSALAGSVLGVALTLVVTGQRDARSRFGDEKQLQGTAVWSSASEPGADARLLLQQMRDRTRYGQALVTLAAALNQLTKAARLDLNVHSPRHAPFPLTAPLK